MVISRLVKTKLVKRTASAADARRLEIAVTPAVRRNVIVPAEYSADVAQAVPTDKAGRIAP